MANFGPNTQPVISLSFYPTPRSPSSINKEKGFTLLVLGCIFVNTIYTNIHVCKSRKEDTLFLTRLQELTMEFCRVVWHFCQLYRIALSYKS